MKTPKFIFSIALGSLLALGGAGCHKQSAASSAAPATLEEGLTKLQAALATASPQAQSNFFNGLSTGIRYADYAKASAALQQIATDPGLNDQQKKLVSDVGDLLKQKAAAAPAH